MSFLRACSLALWCSLLAVVCLAQDGAGSASEAEAADADVQAEYYRVVERAIAEFSASRFTEARALFQQAHELWPSARTWRTLGMTAFELRLYPRALIELRAALDDPRRPLGPDQRTKVEALLEKTKAFVGSYQVTLTPSTARLQVDGAETTLPADGTLVLSVGEHELIARAPDHQEQKILLEVIGHRNEHIDLALDATPPPPPPVVALPTPVKPALHWERPAFDASIGVAATGVALASVFGGLAITKKHVLADNCPDNLCTRAHWDDAARALRFSRAATAGFVLAALGAAGSTLFAIRLRRREQSLALTPLGMYGRF